jgi:spermidine synthase
MNLSWLILPCFFLSGVAGLIYEVLWVRMIDKVVGSAPFAVATVLAAFMGGLALGSYVAGKKVDRSPEKGNLLSLYGRLEIGIGLYGLLLPILIVVAKPVYVLAYDLLFQWFWPYTLFTFAGSALLLLLPASLMGATLPILCRYYVHELDHLGARTGRLYGLNTVGGAVGAVLAGFFLIKEWGIWGSLFFAAGLNLSVGLAALAASWWSVRVFAPVKGRRKGRAAPAAPLEPPVLEGDLSRAGDARWSLWIFACSGFCAMAYEVIWTRLLGLIIGPTTYSFTLVVSTFIIGLALGSLLFGMVGDRVRNPLALLVGTQVLAAFAALWVSQFLGQSQFFFAKIIFTFQNDFLERTLAQSLVVFLALLGPTVLLGATFPIVNKIYARALPRIGGSIGTAYALNTLGAIAGSLAAGLLLIPLIGKENGLRVVAFLQFGTALSAFLWIALRTKKRTPSLALALLVALVALPLFALFPSWDRQALSYGRYRNLSLMQTDFQGTGWFQAFRRGPEILRRHETGREIVFYGDGIGGFTTVEKFIDSVGTEKYTLLSSGKPDASSHGDRSTQTLLAHLPLLFHPHPETVMVLGLASGMTAGEVLLYPVRRVDVLEIQPAVVKACAFFTPWNSGCLQDPRCRIIVQDGRNHLALTRERYDVIISEPSNPWMAGLANLYTLDFFRIVRSRLREGGIFVQWIHSYEMDWTTFSMAGRTFTEVFPKAVVLTTLTGVGDYLLVGFQGDGRLDAEVARKNLPFAQRSRNMSLPNADLLYHLILSDDPKTTFGPGPFHTDNHPRLEFAAPKLLYATDALIEERMTRKATLSPETIAKVRAGSGPDATLDLLEFSTSVSSPLFGMVRPEEMDTAQRQRYAGILARHCREGFVPDYSVFRDRAERAACAEIQAPAIRSHLRRRPEDGPAHYSLGIALMESGRPSEAIDAFQSSLRLDPLRPRAHNALGLARMATGDWAGAEAAFREALSLDPGYSKAYFNLAEMSRRRGNKDRALFYLREGLRYEDSKEAKALLRELLLYD